MIELLHPCPSRSANHAFTTAAIDDDHFQLEPKSIQIRRRNSNNVTERTIAQECDPIRSARTTAVSLAVGRARSNSVFRNPLLHSVVALVAKQEHKKNPVSAKHTKSQYRKEEPARRVWSPNGCLLSTTFADFRRWGRSRVSEERHTEKK